MEYFVSLRLSSPASVCPRGGRYDLKRAVQVSPVSLCLSRFVASTIRIGAANRRSLKSWMLLSTSFESELRCQRQSTNWARESAPIEHRISAGRTNSATLIESPHAPLIGAVVCLLLQVPSQEQ
ncbi:hypothetical protein L596_006787 [Steinernema carpocapsae]|uniref:Uncharacterized protein n=1 Tax=Steinernema carpocapsae TaxID=34508 RepID=A0A4U5P7K3_STECR|nr:hypothetical protein L596_006787 [Steinernema carpocapsae]